MKLIIRPDDLPSDDNIKEKIIENLLDTDGKDFLEVFDSFEEFIKTSFPESDASLSIPDPGEVPEDLLVPREPSSHNCEDPNCPHKARISPLAKLIEGMILHAKKADLTNWEPFIYPIVRLPTKILSFVSSSGPTQPIIGRSGYKPPGCTVVAPGLFDCPPIKMEISSYRIPQYDPVAPTIPYQGQYYYFRKNLS